MRAYVLISGIVFGVVALVHGARLVQDWPVQIAGWSVPIWVSWAGIFAAGALCLWAFRLALKSPQGGD